MTRRQKTVSKILEVKEFTRDQIETAVKNAQERLNHEEDALKALEQSYAKTSSDVTKKQMCGIVPAHEVELCYTYLKHLGKQIEQQKKTIALRAAELAEVKLAMIEAYKEQRVFEILQNKIAREQGKEAAQGEQKEADYQYLTRKDK
jgi:flagellar export protein FliJ